MFFIMHVICNTAEQIHKYFVKECRRKEIDHIKNVLLRNREGWEIRLWVNNDKPQIKTEHCSRVEEKLRYSSNVLEVNLKEFGN